MIVCVCVCLRAYVRACLYLCVNKWQREVLANGAAAVCPQKILKA